MLNTKCLVGAEPVAVLVTSECGEPEEGFSAARLTTAMGRFGTTPDAAAFSGMVAEDFKPAEHLAFKACHPSRQ